jgi:hypothetical protein
LNWSLSADLAFRSVTTPRMTTEKAKAAVKNADSLRL